MTYAFKVLVPFFVPCAAYRRNINLDEPEPDQTVSFSAGGALVERNSSWSKINALNQQQFNCREKL